MPTQLYLGIMSGTSADGIDAALVDFSGTSPSILATRFTPFEDALRDAVVALFTPADNEIDRMGELDNLLGLAYLHATRQLLKDSGTDASALKAVGLHGQTIRHRPEASSPFTLQIGNPYHLSQQLGVTVVSDFRRSDMTVGGQGAPLAPLFHQALFQSNCRQRVIINAGGIANISCLTTDGRVSGFDTGLANGMMDYWIERVRGERYDADGAWARSGGVIDPLLATWLKDPYYQQSPPKSTGKEYFTVDRLGLNSSALENHDPADVQRTLCELSATTVAGAIEQFCPGTEEIYLCGGGAHNSLLSERISTLTGLPAATTESLGVAPDWVEAVGFAWLAKACMDGTVIDTKPVTGASLPIILGAIHPGNPLSNQ